MEDDGSDPVTYSTDGSDPSGTPDCHGLIGFCVGQPVEAVVDQFGVEDERYGSASDGITRAWEGSAVPGARVTVSADPIESIESITVSLLEGSDTRVVTSHGYVIGQNTVSDVLQDPMTADASCDAAEGMVFCDLMIRDGPEGTHLTTYGYAEFDPNGRDVSSPEEVNRLYGDRALTNASTSYY